MKPSCDVLVPAKSRHKLTTSTCDRHTQIYGSTQHVTQYAILVVEVTIYLNTRCVQTVWHSCKMLFMYTYFQHVTIANHFYTHIENNFTNHPLTVPRNAIGLFRAAKTRAEGLPHELRNGSQANEGAVVQESNQKTSQPTSRPKCSYPDSGCKKRCASGHESLQDFLEWFIVRKVRFSCLYYPLLSIKCIHLYPLHIKYPEAEIGTSSKRICKIWKSPGFHFFFVTSGGCTVIVCWWLDHLRLVLRICFGISTRISNWCQQISAKQYRLPKSSVSRA